jgi:CARDB
MPWPRFVLWPVTRREWRRRVRPGRGDRQVRAQQRSASASAAARGPQRAAVDTSCARCCISGSEVVRSTTDRVSEFRRSRARGGRGASRGGGHMSSRSACASVIAVLATGLLVAASASARRGAVLPRPDLVVRSLVSSPSTVAPREPLTATFVVGNVGKWPARASVAAAYLSRDKTKGKGDTRLAPASSLARLKPRKSARRSATLVVPPATPVGPWFVIVCADDTRRVVEARETNNCRAATTPITVTKVPPPPPPPQPPPPQPPEFVAF